MSKIMIYAPLSAIGGNIENVWGHKMRVRTIDSGDKELAETLQAEGWKPKAGDVIEQIETQKLEAENKVMKGVLADGADKERIDELEDEVKELRTKLAIYEESKDANGDGVVSYDEMTIPELSTLLTQREVEHNKRDGKDALVKLATDSE